MSFKPPQENKQQLQEMIKKFAAEIKTLEGQLESERGQRMGKAKLSSFKLNEDVKHHSLKQRKLLRGHFGKVYALQWCHGEAHFEKLVSASQDGKLIVWNGLSGNKTKLIPLSSAWVMSVAYSPTGNFVACGGLDNICSGFLLERHKIPDETQDAATPDFELQHHDGYLSCCRFLSDTQMLTSSGDSLCILWDITTQKPLTVFEGHESDVMSLSPLNPNNTFVSGGCDLYAKVWDQRLGKCVQTFSGHNSDINSIDRFPDGYAFVTGSDDTTARLFDTRSWNEVMSFQKDVNVANTSVAFSGGGRMLFGGYDDNSCRVWDVSTGDLLEPILNSHEKRVSCLGVNYQGWAVATGSWDDSLQIWA